jgi:hypothetical protein
MAEEAKVFFASAKYKILARVIRQPFEMATPS